MQWSWPLDLISYFGLIFTVLTVCTTLIRLTDTTYFVMSYLKNQSDAWQTKGSDQISTLLSWKGRIEFSTLLGPPGSKPPGPEPPSPLSASLRCSIRSPGHEVKRKVQVYTRRHWLYLHIQMDSIIIASETCVIEGKVRLGMIKSTLIHNRSTALISHIKAGLSDQPDRLPGWANSTKPILAALQRTNNKHLIMHIIMWAISCIQIFTIPPSLAKNSNIALPCQFIILFWCTKWNLH